MPPACVERHVEAWITLPHRREHEINCRIEAREIDAEMRQAIGKAQRQHALRAGANRIGAQKRKGIDCVDRHHAVFLIEVS